MTVVTGFGSREVERAIDYPGVASTRAAGVNETGCDDWRLLAAFLARVVFTHSAIDSYVPFVKSTEVKMASTVSENVR
jgi:hypothetical protein